MLTVAAVIPAHPHRQRNGMLDRAIHSVLCQSYPITELHVVVDRDKLGAWHTRQRGLDAVSPRCEYVAFLDSDDVWLPMHVELLAQEAGRYDADFVFSYFSIVTTGGGVRDDLDPIKHLGDQIDPAHPHHTTMTVMVRRELAQRVGFREPKPGYEVGNEDWHFIEDCVAHGARFRHVPARTWLWGWHGQNTSGFPHKGDATL